MPLAKLATTSSSPITRQDRDPVPLPLPVVRRLVAERLERQRREGVVGDLRLLHADDVGLDLGQPPSIRSCRTRSELTFQVTRRIRSGLPSRPWAWRRVCASCRLRLLVRLGGGAAFERAGGRRPADRRVDGNVGLLGGAWRAGLAAVWATASARDLGVVALVRPCARPLARTGLVCDGVGLGLAAAAACSSGSAALGRGLGDLDLGLGRPAPLGARRSTAGSTGTGCVARDAPPSGGRRLSTGLDGGRRLHASSDVAGRHRARRRCCGVRARSPRSRPPPPRRSRPRHGRCAAADRPSAAAARTRARLRPAA